MFAFQPVLINANTAFSQNCYQQETNCSIPIMITFPSLWPNNIYTNGQYSFMIGMTNQNNSIQQEPTDNNQKTDLPEQKQLKNNLTKKIISVINSKLQDCESIPCSSSESNLPNENFINDQNTKSMLQPLQGKCLKNLRTHFTKEEDERIKDLVKQFGTKNWSIIASFMNGRSAKQCRDRYSNYLVPGFFQGEWSNEEDELLKKLYKENGSKWSIIQTYFPNRSSNSIKNRWYYFLRNNKKNDDNVGKETKEVSTPENNKIEITKDKKNLDSQMNLEENKKGGDSDEKTENIFDIEYDLFERLGNNNHNLLFDDEWITFN